MKLATMLREITKGQLLAYHLGRRNDEDDWIPEMISLAKMNNVDIALEIARVARDIHGANGVTDEYPIMRCLLYTTDAADDSIRVDIGGRRIIK